MGENGGRFREILRSPVLGLIDLIGLNEGVRSNQV